MKSVDSRLSHPNPLLFDAQGVLLMMADFWQAYVLYIGSRPLLSVGCGRVLVPTPHCSKSTGSHPSAAVCSLHHLLRPTLHWQVEISHTHTGPRQCE